MVTLMPDVPLMGENEVIVGIPAAATMKFCVLVVPPLGASTAIVPDVAPLGTVVVIIVSDATVNVGWFVPLNRTAVASPLLLNPLPMMVTASVATPHSGVNEEIVAAEAGSAVTIIPIAPTANAIAAARAETLFCFWCLNIVPPFLAATRTALPAEIIASRSGVSDHSSPPPSVTCIRDPRAEGPRVYAGTDREAVESGAYQRSRLSANSSVP
jgi:hypothetical protein